MSMALHYKSLHSPHILTWQEFLENVKEYGFETGFCKSEEGGFEERVFFNPQKGIIIYAFTYSGKYANHTVAYGELKIKGDDTDKTRVMSSFKHFQISDGVIAFSLDVKGLEELLKMRVQFVIPWRIGQEMQLTNFDERQRLSQKEQNKLIQDKIRKCPREMKAIIGFR